MVEISKTQSIGGLSTCRQVHIYTQTERFDKLTFESLFSKKGLVNSLLEENATMANLVNDDMVSC